MIICFDTETTGLEEEDEIIQLSIADASTGRELLNESFRPSDRLMERRWEGASEVTGVYPEDLVGCRSLEDPEVRAEIQDILDRAELVIGYHVAFDVEMMERHGFDMTRFEYQDPMYAFASYYWHNHPDETYVNSKGEEKDPWLQWAYNGYGKGRYIPKNLTFAANWFGIYDFGAHDAMNDVMATIAVWEEMNNIQEEINRRGVGYAPDGEVYYDDYDNACPAEEDGSPLIDPNGNGLWYVDTYTYDQLMEIDRRKRR